DGIRDRNVTGVQTCALPIYFEQFLRSTGRWERSVVIVLADHGMDWSDPMSLISAAGALDADPLLRGRFGIAQNGGADTFAYLGRSEERRVGQQCRGRGRERH